jgi:Calcium-binding EGF domain
MIIASNALATKVKLSVYPKDYYTVEPPFSLLYIERVEDISRPTTEMVFRSSSSLVARCVSLDIDECKYNGTELCELTAECKNTQGSYTCQCLNGYNRMGDTVNEDCRGKCVKLFWLQKQIIINMMTSVINMEKRSSM